MKRGDLVGVGQAIGRIGNTGTGDHHVHYQLKDSAGRPINPTNFWDELGPTKTDPGQPAYLGEYQQYLDGLGTRFGDAPGPAAGLLFQRPLPMRLSRLIARIPSTVALEPGGLRRPAPPRAIQTCPCGGQIPQRRAG